MACLDARVAVDRQQTGEVVDAALEQPARALNHLRWLCHDNLSERGAKLRKQHLRLGGRSVPPLIHGFRSEEMQSASGDQVALNIECVVHGGVAGEEALG